MNSNRRHTFAALVSAGLLWGTTVPLSKLALHWLPPGWLTVVRFAVAAAILLPAARHQLRAAFRPALLASGAIGYGGSVVLQNTGITRTSVSHAALLIGAVPVLVAIITAVWHHTVARPLAWAGFGVSLAGVAVVGTLAPFTLFAYGQSKVSAEVAGAFVNLEPVVGAAAGAVVFGDPASLG